MVRSMAWCLVAAVVLASWPGTVGAQHNDPRYLLAGSLAQVSGTGTQGLRVRAAPELNSELRAVLIEGGQVEMLEGPIAADGYQWYRVQYDSMGRLGWVAAQFLTAYTGPPVATQ